MSCGRDAVAAPGTTVERRVRASDAAEDAVCLAVLAVPLRALKTSCGLSERSRTMDIHMMWTSCAHHVDDIMWTG